MIKKDIVEQIQSKKWNIEYHKKGLKQSKLELEILNELLKKAK